MSKNILSKPSLPRFQTTKKGMPKVSTRIPRSRIQKVFAKHTKRIKV